MSRDYIGDPKEDMAWSLRSIDNSLEKLVELLETHLTVTEDSHETDQDHRDHGDRGTGEPVHDRGQRGDSLRKSPAVPGEPLREVGPLGDGWWPCPTCDGSGGSNTGPLVESSPKPSALSTTGIMPGMKYGTGGNMLRALLMLEAYGEGEFVDPNDRFALIGDLRSAVWSSAKEPT